MKSIIRSLTFDCANPLKQAEFWAAALDYRLDEIDDEGATIIGSYQAATALTISDSS